MAQHKKNYTSFLRGSSNSKKRNKQRKNIVVSKKQIKDYEENQRKEKESGLYELRKFVKDNYMVLIHQLLYNTYLVPSERLCIKYKGDFHSCKGKLRTGEIIEVVHNRKNSRNYYDVYIDNIKKGRIQSQSETVRFIKDLLNLRRWDCTSGSEYVTFERYGRN